MRTAQSQVADIDATPTQHRQFDLTIGEELWTIVDLLFYFCVLPKWTRPRGVGSLRNVQSSATRNSSRMRDFSCQMLESLVFERRFAMCSFRRREECLRVGLRVNYFLHVRTCVVGTPVSRLRDYPESQPRYEDFRRIDPLVKYLPNLRLEMEVLGSRLVSVRLPSGVDNVTSDKQGKFVRDLLCNW